MARPEHVFDPIIAGKVEAYSSIPLSQEFIALKVNLTVKTMMKHYSDYYQTGKDNVTAMVENALVHQAVVKENVSAIMFYLRCKAGWKDKDNENTSIDQLKDAMLKALAAKLPD